MASIDPALAVYLLGVALTSLRFGWHMVFRLDRFDWQYARRDVWLIFVGASLLWPLLLFRPKVLLNPGNLFHVNFSESAMGRKEARFWSNPPPCGKSIRYRPHKIVLSGGEGEFTFASADVEDAILKELREHPQLAKNQIGSVLKWLQQRDDSIDDPTAIPDRWWDFHGIADNLLRSGHGEIRCLTCNRPIPNELIKQNDLTGQPGWNFNQLRCPGGHVLLSVETMHIFVGSRKSTNPDQDIDSSS
jgi:hypothetical protein